MVLMFKCQAFSINWTNVNRAMSACEGALRLRASLSLAAPGRRRTKEEQWEWQDFTSSSLLPRYASHQIRGTCPNLRTSQRNLRAASEQFTIFLVQLVAVIFTCARTHCLWAHFSIHEWWPTSKKEKYRTKAVSQTHRFLWSCCCCCCWWNWN